MHKCVAGDLKRQHKINERNEHAEPEQFLHDHIMSCPGWELNPPSHYVTRAVEKFFKRIKCLAF